MLWLHLAFAVSLGIQEDRMDQGIKLSQGSTRGRGNGIILFSAVALAVLAGSAVANQQHFVQASVESGQVVHTSNSDANSSATGVGDEVKVATTDTLATAARSDSSAANSTASVSSSSADNTSETAQAQGTSSSQTGQSMQSSGAASNSASSSAAVPAVASATAAVASSQSTVTVASGNVAQVEAAKSAAAATYAATGVPQKVVAVASTVPQPTFSSQAKQQNFIVSVEQGALAGWYEYKILPSITVAQAILESGWGTSKLAQTAHNMFGIKDSDDWSGATVAMPTTEVINGKTIQINAQFRAYSSILASIEDHGAFLSRKTRYSNLVGNTHYKSVANNLHADGYATDPGYAGKLINLVEECHLTVLDSIAIGGDTISGHVVDPTIKANGEYFDTILSNAAVNYGAQIVEGSRNDGLYHLGPFYTSKATRLVATVSARTLNGQYVRVLRKAQTGRGWWVQIQLQSGVTWWVDQNAIKQVADSAMFDQVTSTKAVNYGAYIQQSGRKDGLFGSGPYMTSASTFVAPAKFATETNNQAVTVIAESVTRRGTWVHVRLVSGASWWMDKRGTALYDQISQQRDLNINVRIQQNSRSDGLYATGPYHTDASTVLVAAKTARPFNQQGATALREATTVLGKWVQVRLSDASTWWMDERGVSFFEQITNAKSETGYVTIAQNTRNDGLYATGPYMTSVATYIPAHKTAKPYHGQTAQALGEAQTKRATWIHVKLADGSTWWIDKRGVTPFVFDEVTARKAVSYNAQIAQNTRNDGLYHDGPYMTGTTTYAVAAKTAKSLNGQQVQVIAEAVTKRATWVQIKLVNGETWWMDKQGVLAFDAITNRTIQNHQVTVQQDSRNDGLYQSAPYFTSVDTKNVAAKHAKQYNGQKATVLLTASTIHAQWVYVQFADGSRWWMDARGIR